MKIETKYNIGDEVHYILGHKAVQGTVFEIQSRVFNHPVYGRIDTDTTYFVGETKDSARHIEEHLLFPTKEELLFSL